MINIFKTETAKCKEPAECHEGSEKTDLSNGQQRAVTLMYKDNRTLRLCTGIFAGFWLEPESLTLAALGCGIHSTRYCLHQRRQVITTARCAWLLGRDRKRYAMSMLVRTKDPCRQTPWRQCEVTATPDRRTAAGLRTASA